MVCLFKKSFILLPFFQTRPSFLLPSQHMIFHWDHNASFDYFFKNYTLIGLLKTFAALLLIKHDRFGVLVCHLGHVSQNIFFCDDSKKSPTPCHQALPEPQFPEDVHNSLHGCVVCDSERAQVQDAPQFQGMWAVSRQLRGLLCEVHDGIAHDALLPLSGILYSQDQLSPLSKADETLWVSGDHHRKAVVVCLFDECLHVLHGHAVLGEYRQWWFSPPGPHHICGQGTVGELILHIEKWVPIQMDVGFINPFFPKGISHPLAGDSSCHQGHNILQASSQFKHDDDQWHCHPSHPT